MTIKNLSEELMMPVAKLCRRTMVRDIMPDHLFKEKTTGEEDYDPYLNLVSFTEDDNENPIGFISGVIKERQFERIGYIKLLCVDENHRKKKVATELYNMVEGKMLEDGVKKIRVYESYPNYFMPGIDPFYTEAVCFFETKKFKRFNDTCNLAVDLLQEDYATKEREEELLNQGIVIKRAEKQDKDKIFMWMKNNFAAWDDEVNCAFRNEPATLFIATINDEIKAFAAHDANNKGLGWFGPMGTDVSIREKGVGAVLLRKSLKDLKDMGYAKAIIPWVGPIPFYAKHANAKVERVFWRYEKEFI